MYVTVASEIVDCQSVETRFLGSLASVQELAVIEEGAAVEGLKLGSGSVESCNQSLLSPVGTRNALVPPGLLDGAPGGRGLGSAELRRLRP